MRYPAGEKLEIIQLVERSHLPVRRTLEKLGIPRATFYRWYDLYRTGGPGTCSRWHGPPPRWERLPKVPPRTTNDIYEVDYISILDPTSQF
jgi:putative transposase